MTPAPQPGPRTEGPSRTRRSRLALLALAAVLSGGNTPAAPQAPTRPAELTFDHYELLLGPAKRQTVVAGSFLGGELADLAVVHHDGNGERRLSLYGHGDGSWEPRVEAELHPGVRFVDLARVGGRDRLITYADGRLAWFDPEAATERELAEVPTAYKWKDEGAIPRVQVSRDLNHDGRDDLVLPDVDGFWIVLQREDGSFADAVKLGPPEPFLERLGEDEARRYRQEGITALAISGPLSRVHELDYDQDGRSDLVFWNGDHFDVHVQDDSGGFDPVARRFTADVPLDSDGVYLRMADFHDEGMLSLVFGLGKSTQRTILDSFRDLDGDGVADLVTLTLSGRGITRQRSRYEVHFGTATADGTVFAREAGATIQPRGKAGGMQPWGYSSQWFEDFDGDGQVDILFRDVKVGFGGMVRTLSARSIPINLQLYRGEDGVYPDRPSARRKIRPAFHTFGRSGVFFPAALIGDVNGDGRLDLLVGGSRRELHVFLGVPGPDLLAQQPLEVAVALPDDERNSRLVDLNRDGRKDLLVHHRSGSGPQRVTLLIAR